jgi:hypothetical protein
MKLKLKLTPDEIIEYNEYKNKICSARTKTEINEYELKAKSIIQRGRNRYVNELETKKSLNIC